MILGANFSSESGPEIPLNLSLLIRFGGHVTMKKGTRWLLITKKGATCGISPPLLAPTESPKRFPNRPSTPMVQRVSPVLLPVQRLPPPATAFPTPGAGYPPKATPSQGRAGGGEAGCGRARLGLDWCGTLEQPHGRLLPAAMLELPMMPSQDQHPRLGVQLVQPAAAADESGTTPQEIRGCAPGASACLVGPRSDVPPRTCHDASFFNRLARRSHSWSRVISSWVS